MTTDVTGSSHLGGLLRDSVNYARKTVRAVTSEELSQPTPCREWDLRALLNHLNDSLLTLSTARRREGRRAAGYIRPVQRTTADGRPAPSCQEGRPGR